MISQPSEAPFAAAYPASCAEVVYAGIKPYKQVQWSRPRMPT